MITPDRLAAALFAGIIAAAGFATAANFAAQDSQLMSRCQARDSVTSCRLQMFGR